MFWKSFAGFGNNNTTAIIQETVGDSLGAGLSKYYIGIQSSVNNCIYSPPYSATAVLKIDPSDDTVSTFGTLNAATNKWYNIVEANDGKLYSIPNNHTEILEIDPSDDSTVTYSGATSPVATSVKWPDAMLADNGNIYAAPNRAQDVLEFNPTTKGINLFGGFADNVGKWSKMVKSDDGKLYAGPIGSETSILEIDPSIPSATKRELGIIVASSYNDIIYLNGKIYCIPLNATGVGIFDTDDKSFRTIGNFSGTFKWNHAILGSNGKIYCIPRKATYILEIDPITEELVTFGNVGDPDIDLRWNKAVLSSNGKIYAFPAYNYNRVLEIEPCRHAARELPTVSTVSTHNWHWNIRGGRRLHYGIPLDNEYVLKLEY